MKTNKYEPRVIDKNLSQKTITGSFWVFLARVSQQGISLLQLAILAWMLNPRDFGLMGVASIMTQAIAVFFYTGYEYALVQKSDLRDADIQSAWWVMLSRRVAIGLILGLASYPISVVYRELAVVPIIWAMAIIQIISSLTSPATIILQKDLRFKQLFFFIAGTSFIGLVTGIIVALFLRNVWALVASLAATTIFQVILSYALYPFKPVYTIEKSAVSDLTKYGRWMLGSAILWFTFTQGANFYSGWLFGIVALGQYQLSSRFALFPSTQISETISSTLFPSIAILQADEDRVSQAFLRTLGVSSGILAGITVLLAIWFPNVLVSFLGDKWIQAAQLMPVIALSGGIIGFFRLASSLFLGTGHPRYLFIMDLIQTITAIACLYPLGRIFGIYGLPYATLLGGVLAMPVWWIGVKRIAKLDCRQTLKYAIPGLIGSISMGIILIILRDFIPVQGKGISFYTLMVYAIQLLFGCLFFIAGLYGAKIVMREYSPLSEISYILGAYGFSIRR